MDDAEKRVLRRRKPALVESVTLNDDMFTEIQAIGLLTPENVQQVKSEVAPNLRIHKMMELVLGSTAEGAFLLFCELLSTKYPWLSRDLEADAKIEKGDYFVEEDIQKEASMLVHRKFGTSKRLCEGDKKDISDLIALKLQITKEEHQRDLDKVNGHLKDEKDKNSYKDKLTRQLAAMMKKFVQKHRTQLTTHAHGMKSTTQTLLVSLEENSQDMLAKHVTNTETLFDRFAQVLSYKDTIIAERDRAFKLLKETDDKLSMDDAIRKWMLAQEAAEAKREANSLKVGQAAPTNGREGDVRRLNKKITDLEHDVMDKDELITELKTDLVSRENEMANMKARIEELQAQLAEATAASAQVPNGNVAKPKKATTGKAKRPGTGSVKSYKTK